MKNPSSFVSGKDPENQRRQTVFSHRFTTQHIYRFNDAARSAAKSWILCGNA